MLSAGDVVGLYGIVPTPAKPGADRLTAVDTVDLEETEKMVEALIGDGVDGLIALGTTGECATLSDEDYRQFAKAFLEVVDGRVPTFMGTSALGGHGVAERMRFVGENGADGALLGLPMWQPLTTRMAVDFYSEISAAFPDIAIMVYANKRAFRYSFPIEFWEGVVKQAPSVIAAKYSRPPDLRQLLDLTDGRIHIVPNEMTVAGFFEVAPETTKACWATAASMGPAAVVALMDALGRGDAEGVARISAELARANEPVRDILRDPEIFASYNIQIEKARINAAGYVQAGPCRPPYQHLPEEFAGAAEQCGQRWRELHHSYLSKREKADG